MVRNRYKKPGSPIFSIALAFPVAVAITLLLYCTPLQTLISSWEESTSDYLFLLNTEKQKIHSNPITIILLDEAGSMAYGYRSPVPRLLLADLTDFLMEKQAKVIGMDILLDRRYRAADDERLRQSLQNAQGRVVLADIHPDQTEHENQAGLTRLNRYFSSVAPSGYTQIKLGSGDLARWFRLDTTADHRSFSEEIFQKFRGQPFSGLETYCATQTPCWVRFNFTTGNTGIDRNVSAFPVLTVGEALQAPDELFRDRIVLIGSGIPDLGDVFLTPFSQVGNQYQPIFGVQLHAINLDMMLNRQFIEEMPRFWMIINLLLLTLGFGILISVFRPLYAALFLVVTSFFVTGGAVLLFLQLDLLYPIIGPLIGLVAVFLSIQLLSHSRLQVYSRKIKQSLDRTNDKLFQTRNNLLSAEKEKQRSLENERKRIAQDIHDDLGQLLTALKFDLSFLTNQSEPPNADVLKKTGEMNLRITQIIQSTRNIISDLRPKILDDLGLAAAVDWLVEAFEQNSATHCISIVDLKEAVLNEDKSLALFRMLQEALNNISKHAKASQVRIKLLGRDQQVVLQITDNGVGFSPEEKTSPKAFGLTGLKERAAAFGGSCRIRSMIGRGTTLRIALPVSAI